jgi:hypothetical protein
MIHDFLKAIGQYVGYETVIEKKMMNRQLYLAMPYYVYNKLEKFDFVIDIINRVHIKLILFNPITETIVEWKN